ncbi:stonustoxin subunit beta-like [Thunnus albacares]|uniref:stonustoxin subunit beta-like n=1 Tax=Thunnus albacares TaxID=8236 RepID=UPI001CF63686|nr:stonustoxin subunit beta-like [Thunnus albacares]
MSKMAVNAKVAAEKKDRSIPSYNREWYLQYWVDLTLDPDTAYSKLKLSEKNKKVELTDVTQTHDESPKRFRYVPQVLCKEGLTTGRSYWEIDWVGAKGAGIAVSYDTIRRDTADDECRFGCNPQSWRFQDGVQRDFLYNDWKTPIFSCYNIIGVYLDVEAGTLQYYGVTPDREEMVLLYEAPQFKPSAPLYPGFWLCEGTKLTICPKQQCKKSQRT